MHYTEQPSSLEARADTEAGVLWLKGAGFLTATMVEEAFARMRKDAPLSPKLLIDLREFSGYEHHAVAQARHLLPHAPKVGVKRIAFVVPSAAVHTATRVISGHAGVPLRSFHSEGSARDWLG